MAKNKTETSAGIKITLGELKNMERTLGKIFSMDLPVSTAYSLSKLLRVAKTELDTLESLRSKLVEKYGKEKFLQESGKIEIPVGTPEYQSYDADHTELKNKTVHLNVERVKLDDLRDIKLTPADLYVIEPILVH